MFMRGRLLKAAGRSIALTGLSLVYLIATVQAQTSRAVSARSYLERGNARAGQGEMERAIAGYNLALAFDSGLAVACYNRGRARHALGDFEEA